MCEEALKKLLQSHRSVFCQCRAWVCREGRARRPARWSSPPPWAPSKKPGAQSQGRASWYLPEPGFHQNLPLPFLPAVFLPGDVDIANKRSQEGEEMLSAVPKGLAGHQASLFTGHQQQNFSASISMVENPLIFPSVTPRSWEETHYLI